MGWKMAMTFLATFLKTSATADYHASESVLESGNPEKDLVAWDRTLRLDFFKSSMCDEGRIRAIN